MYGVLIPACKLPTKVVSSKKPRKQLQLATTVFYVVMKLTRTMYSKV